MKFESEEFEQFTNSLALKFTIKDVRSLFIALDPVGPYGCIGGNGMWNWQTGIYLVHDNYTNDRVLVCTFRGRTRMFREQEIMRFHKKDLFMYAYDELTKL